jgi:hypothetical protein
MLEILLCDFISFIRARVATLAVQWPDPTLDIHRNTNATSSHYKHLPLSNIKKDKVTGRQFWRPTWGGQRPT